MGREVNMTRHRSTSSQVAAARDPLLPSQRWSRCRYRKWFRRAERSIRAQGGTLRDRALTDTEVRYWGRSVWDGLRPIWLDAFGTRYYGMVIHVG